MNKRGTTIFISLMIGVVFFLFGLAIAYPISQVTKTARLDTNTSVGVETGLNCSSATEYQDRANCVAVDVMTPLFLGTIFGMAGFILGRAFL